MAPLLEVKNLKKYFEIPSGILHAVDNISFAFEKGKTLGVVGESGCGKSTLGRTIIHLLPVSGGNIVFKGQDITLPKKRELKTLRKEMQIIFQDPFSSLNPRYIVEKTITEVLRLNGYNRQQVKERSEEVMDLVGIDERLRKAYPHELDGGRRQRVVIARALALKPLFVVCDEPVSALDVSIQAQVLNLLQDLQEQMNLTYLFITHDLSVVKHISNEICVMYMGQIVEKSQTDDLFDFPFHPYSQALLSAIPTINIHDKKEKAIMEGELSSPVNPKPGCRFAARCRFSGDNCTVQQTFSEIRPGHFVRCCMAGKAGM
jgi:oligopeptide/dipeptide ABC transporter ATP-binding protein